MQLLTTPLLLASGSPRRQEILHSLGLPFVTSASYADETLRPGEAADNYIERVVNEKLQSGLVEAARADHDLVLVADTIVVAQGAILGKPVDDADNRRMLARLAGQTHEVWTRFALARRAGPTCLQTVRTCVTFRPLQADEIDAYVASGEGRDKAGGYAIQGLGAFAVVRIDGSYSNVVGLPACELVMAIQQLTLTPKGSS